MFQIKKITDTLDAVVMNRKAASTGKRGRKEPHCVIMVDETGSMDSLYGEKTRFEYAKELIKGIGNENQSFRVMFFNTRITQVFYGNIHSLEEILDYEQGQLGTDITQSLLECLECIFEGNPTRESDHVLDEDTVDVHLVLVTDGDDKKFNSMLQLELPDGFCVKPKVNGDYPSTRDTLGAIKMLMAKVTSFWGIGIGDVKIEDMSTKWVNLSDTPQKCTMLKVKPNALGEVIVPIREIISDIVEEVEIEVMCEDGEVIKIPTQVSTQRRKVHFIEGKELIATEQVVRDDSRPVVIPALVTYFIDKADKESDVIKKVEILDEAARIVQDLSDNAEDRVCKTALKRLAVMIVSLKSSGDAMQDAVAQGSARLVSNSLAFTDSVDTDGQINMTEINGALDDHIGNPVSSGRSLSCVLGFDQLRVRT